MVILDLLRARRCCSSLFASLLLASAAAAATDEKPARSAVAYPMVISGSHLDELRGAEIDRIRLFASRQGVMQAIPMQIDQLDSHGNWVWSGIVERGPIHNTEHSVELQWELDHRYGRTYDDQDPDNEAVLDNNDVLVFMARDMGERAANAASRLSNAATTLEIEVFDPDRGSQGWVYAAYYPSTPPPRSPVRYVKYVPDLRKVISPVYEITFSKEHVGVMEQLAVAGAPLLDRTKFRGSLRVGGSRFGRSFSFTENDIEGYVYGYIDGPVRVIRRTVASMRISLLLSSSTVACDQFFYPYHSEIPVRLPVNFLVHSASLLVEADYHNSPFRHAYTNGNSHPISLSGPSSDQNLLEDEADPHWVALAGGEVSIVSVLTLPEELKPFTRVTPWLLYDRKLTNPPETYVGTEPGAGYLIETRPGLPSGEYMLLGTYLYLPRPFQQGDAQQLLDLGKHKYDYRTISVPHERTFQGPVSPLRPAPVS